MHNNNSIVPYISLCSGYEGIGLGLHRCIPNLRCIGYCEREAFAISNLVAKMENGLLDAAPVFTDVTTFPWRDYAPFMAGGILSFGWPCQPVSTAGKRKATEDERWLFDIIADGISILRPGTLFAENVEGLLSAKMPDGSSVFGHCIERLESLHYKVAAGIFSASEVGAVHQRKRVFIMAHRNEPRWEARWHNALARNRGGWTYGSAAYRGDQGREELAHNKSWTSGGLSERAQEKNSEFGFNCEAELADTSSVKQRATGLSSARICGCRIQEQERIQHQSSNCGKGSIEIWPSRPSQPQYAWEPPRVVENSKLVGRRGRGNGNEGGLHGEIQTAGSCCEREQISEIKPEVGRDIDGHTYGVDISKLSSLSHSELAEIREWMVKGDNRTDELRSCGNGVVPATAERAFRILMEELINK
jgi:site-specific DNA-cytosine methylase